MLFLRIAVLLNASLMKGILSVSINVRNQPREEFVGYLLDHWFINPEMV